MTNAPATAAARTRLVKKALGDAGYTARVTSAPASHRAQVTTIDQCETLADVAAYLGGYLVGLATTHQREGFVSVRWT